VIVPTALRSRFIHPFPPLAGLVSLEIGGLVLFGWAIDSPDLKSLAAGLIPMMPNAALAFIFAGLSLLTGSVRSEATGLRVTAVRDQSGSRSVALP
jgi:hypothetical protein